MSSEPRLRMRLRPAAESIVRSGHPWVFAESLRDQNREGAPGELAVIYDRRDRFLALGLYDPDSPLRVRILHQGKPETIDMPWWRKRLGTALERRRPLFDDPATTGYRLINGESDGWPGLVLDRYDQALVLKLYTAAWFPRLKEIVALLHEEIECLRTVLRLSRNLQSLAGSRASPWKEGFTFFRSPAPPLPTPGPATASITTFTENGLTFQADLLRGQKTGFFLDQRENRQRVGSMARGRRVLNAFSFSGGFSLYAARGGATSVTDLDISAHALEGAKTNFRLNAGLAPVSACQHHTVQADAFHWLSHGGGARFDMVILDPPSLARRETERTGALQAYARLARGGAALLAPNGILMAASCSAHVSTEEFFHTVRTSLTQSGYGVTELERTGHALDHPATFPEARYLKGVFLQIKRGGA